MKKYQVIYADPPWQYQRNTASGAAEKHYPTMKTCDLCRLPVNELADKNCTLFMWTTFPMIPDALELVNAWGFLYKTVAFVWVKRNRKSEGWFWGLGGWTRSNAEICLLATKGKPKRISASVHQIIDSPVEAHSKKPELAREKIIELLGEVPRVELFARQRPKGWDAWGNEITSDFILEERGKVWIEN
ncbi:MT-A70 family methyltransferase [Anaerovoracaceae bacterium 41-7]|uniref:DNA methyltransferase n=1 Tax=Anaerotruncus colihominis TaxID=169435 RepID=A0A845QLJ0_9FIRM|nr:DNA methyltransferase [Emergencia sp.]NBH60948.1 DNA methyltransferase [Anaerotruncus colihominis]NCF01603.1 DNA methyltransferase [Anaerotruncus sp. 80]